MEQITNRDIIYKSRVEIDVLLNGALTQVFGGSPRPRFRPGSGGLTLRKKWKNNSYQTQQAWTGININNDLIGSKGK